MVGLAASSLATINAGQVKADNTKVNKADRDPLTPTADQQKNNRTDRI
jgi:hypothetical protein